ncbi:MAG: helix-turn-helix domain-containing protein, partial [Pyrinomonadaceae bacterium]
MKSKSTADSVEADVANTSATAEDKKLAPAGSRIRNVKELTLRLLREVQSIGEVHQLSLDKGLDFYEAVTRFEIDLIKLALLQTGGHQRQAARLLNLKVTTLNSKIKHYRISLDDFTKGYSVVVPGEVENHQS